VSFVLNINSNCAKAYFVFLEVMSTELKGRAAL
jgi:hypothetical protein